MCEEACIAIKQIYQVKITITITLTVSSNNIKTRLEVYRALESKFKLFSFNLAERLKILRNDCCECNSLFSFLIYILCFNYLFSTEVLDTWTFMNAILFHFFHLSIIFLVQKRGYNKLWTNKSSLLLIWMDSYKPRTSMYEKRFSECLCF